MRTIEDFNWIICRLFHPRYLHLVRGQKVIMYIVAHMTVNFIAYMVIRIIAVSIRCRGSQRSHRYLGQ